MKRKLPISKLPISTQLEASGRGPSLHLLLYHVHKTSLKKIAHKINLLHWNPITISKKGLPMFFAGDLILFDRANEENYNTIKNTMNKFSLHSDQKNNFPKFKVLFSNNCSLDTNANLAKILNIQV